MTQGSHENSRRNLTLFTCNKPLKILSLTSIHLIHEIAVILWQQHLRRIVKKPTKWHVRPAKTQISLGIRRVWSVFAVRLKKAWVLSYLLSAQRRLWSDLGGCPGWSESSLGVHAISFVLSRCGSFAFHCVFLFAKALAISCAYLFPYRFICPDVRHVFLEIAYVTVTSELTVWAKHFYGELLFTVCGHELFFSWPIIWRKQST